MKYHVLYSITASRITEVEAETPGEAREKLLKALPEENPILFNQRDISIDKILLVEKKE